MQWLVRPLPAAGWRRGPETRRETRGLIRASLLALVHHTPDKRNSPFVAKPLTVWRFERRLHHAAVSRSAQARAWFPTA
jgi:hypothetical protein